MIAGHLYIFFEEKSIRVLYPFFSWAICFLLLSCRDPLSIRGINLSLLLHFVINVYVDTVSSLNYFFRLISSIEISGLKNITFLRS